MAAVNRRDSLKKSLCRTGKSADENLSAGEATVVLQSLENYFAKFLDAQLLVDEVSGKDEADFQEIEMITTEKVYVETKIKLLGIISAANPQHQQQIQAIGPPAARVHNKMKIKAIELQKFSGDYREWTSFSDMFTSLVRNDNSIANAQKLYILKAHLVDEALDLVATYPVTDANFATAWESLKERYFNIRYIVDAHLLVLLEQPKLTRECSEGLKKLVDTSVNATRCLQALDLPIDQYDAILVLILRLKLDSETHRQWELHLGDSTELVKFDDFIKFLTSRWKSLHRIPHSSSDPTAYSAKTKQPIKSKVSTQSLIVTQEVASKCVKCDGEHRLYQCEAFKAMDVDQRTQFVATNNACFICLQQGHSSSNCRGRKCFTCRKRHNTLLHKSSATSNVSFVPPVTASYTSPPPSSTVSTLHSQTNRQVLLATATIVLHGNSGEKHTIRALLDSGSEASFISEDCVQRLRLRRSPAYVAVHGVGKTEAGCAKGIVNLRMSSVVDSSFDLPFTALILPKLTNLIPSNEITHQNWPHLAGIKLADATYGIPGRIDVLIGADIYGSIVLNGFIPATNDSPIAQNTRLGWVLLGATSANESSSVQCNVVSINQYITLERSLQKFWEMEAVNEPRVLNSEEQACEDHFVANYTRRPDGRFVVRLPLLPDSTLGESKTIAHRRFLSVERRLGTQPALKQQYINFMDDYADLDHMERIPKEELTNQISYYLPHHAVYKDSSSTTKVRVVFDASSKTTSGKSLNNIQMTGARLQDNLFDIVLRFRQHRIALSADIAKMYRQVLVHKDDLHFQRILWRPDVLSNIEEWRLKTVTYGMTAAPFLAIRALRQLAVLEANKFPLASKVLLTDFYVDDLISGCDSIEEAKILQRDLTQLLLLGGFDLRKWSSNDPAVLQDVPSEYCESKSPLALSEEESVGTLGILWYPSSDNFGFKVRSNKNDQIYSKRTILSEISSLFDPLGWLSPSIIIGKILLRELWLLGCDWDQPVPSEMRQRWQSYRSGLEALEHIRIPRWLQSYDAAHLQLHGFCDASEKAIAAVIYLRSVAENASITTILVTAKTKVAPVKTVTIPRLELCGAQLLAKLLQYVRQTLRLPSEIEYFAWTDSSIVLAWIQKIPINLKTFVANRVSDIQGRTAPSRWRHINSEQNPADCGSRGVDPENLPTHTLWWNGPIWLAKPELEWPVSIFSPVPDDKLEMKTSVFTTLVESKSEWNLFTKYSSTNRLMRITAYIHRAVNNFRNFRDHGKCKFGFLTTIELNDALNFWLKYVQQIEFATEIRSCNNNVTLAKSSKLLNLHPFLDNDGLLRVGGRLNASNLPAQQRNPIVLPEKHYLTSLFIADSHKMMLHAGVQLTLSRLRTMYWIIGGRRAVALYIRQCVTCCRQRGSTLQQLMGEKTAFRRFVSRRGKCAELFSDNGTNFVGATKELQQMLNDEQLGRSLVNDGISWHKIPPGSPHQGGLWEAGVKAMKHHLRRILGNSLLNFEELTTVLCQIEACLNSRPLCPLTDDINDFEALTPGHFLVGESLMTIPEKDLSAVPENHLNRWKLIQKLHQHFWHRWSSEYLSTLQQRPKWKTAFENVKRGDLALLKDDRLPPAKWSLGRIIDVHPGSDGIVRVATLKCNGGQTSRAVQRLCILPTN